ncbi:peptidase M1 [bacterium]|nr:peptidase M1 [bacterium]
MNTCTRFLFIVIVCLAGYMMITGCSGDDDDDTPPPWNPPAAVENWQRDILSTTLAIDMSAFKASATISIGTADSTGCSFEAGGLGITSVRCAQGDLNYVIADGNLHVGIPQTEGPFELIIDYTFSYQDVSEGFMETGVTLIWPYFCGNLFPCHSEPVDGLRFNLTVNGYDAALQAVYPQAIPTDCPSYQIAWAIGQYSYLNLGSTQDGTEIGLWVLPGDETKALQATTHLVDIFNWYEQVLGPYAYGDKAGSVEVIWGAGSYGGMEHHPYWHIAKGAIGMTDVHTHEAAHGWYGDGIRIRCWEDFVLSEGTVTYLTARVTGQIVGADAEALIWEDYDADLNYVINHNDGIAWPDSCGEVDILEDGLFSLVPYLKGAFFYKDVADEIGADRLDQVLSSFFNRYVGDAALMQDMIDHILAETGFDANELAQSWLRSYGRPD